MKDLWCVQSGWSYLRFKKLKHNFQDALEIETCTHYIPNCRAPLPTALYPPLSSIFKFHHSHLLLQLHQSPLLFRLYHYTPLFWFHHSLHCINSITLSYCLYFTTRDEALIVHSFPLFWLYHSLPLLVLDYFFPLFQLHHSISLS